MTTQEPPLSTPDYSATYHQALGRFFTRWARFKGRSSSREFWFPALTIALGAVLLTVVQEWMARHPDIATEWAEALYQAMGIAGLALFIPALSLAWRRLHDSGMSGGWVLLGIIPWAESSCSSCFSVAARSSRSDRTVRTPNSSIPPVAAAP